MRPSVCESLPPAELSPRGAITVGRSYTLHYFDRQQSRSGRLFEARSPCPRAKVNGYKLFVDSVQDFQRDLTVVFRNALARHCFLQSSSGTAAY